MRKGICVPMMTLCLMLCSCGAKEAEPESVQSRYQEMAGCTMEAEICCDQKGTEWEAVLRCDYIPGENSTVEVLLPETIAGIRAVFDDTEWCLEYEDAVLDIGTLSEEKISPALCLPLLMDALREGWILEENTEDWNGVPCLRVTMDQSGDHGKIAKWRHEMSLRNTLVKRPDLLEKAELSQKDRWLLAQMRAELQAGSETDPTLEE